MPISSFEPKHTTTAVPPSGGQPAGHEARSARAAEISAASFKAWRAGQQLVPKARNGDLAAVCRVVDWLVDLGLLEWGPRRAVKQ